MDSGAGRIGNAIETDEVVAFDEAIIIMAISDGDLSNGKADAAVAIDWDGTGLNWDETVYSFDLIDVVYKK